jgi:hypothetical protein
MEDDFERTETRVKREKSLISFNVNVISHLCLGETKRNAEASAK